MLPASRQGTAGVAETKRNTRARVDGAVNKPLDHRKYALTRTATTPTGTPMVSALHSVRHRGAPTFAIRQAKPYIALSLMGRALRKPAMAATPCRPARGDMSKSSFF